MDINLLSDISDKNIIYTNDPFKRNTFSKEFFNILNTNSSLNSKIIGECYPNRKKSDSSDKKHYKAISNNINTNFQIKLINNTINFNKL